MLRIILPLVLSLATVSAAIADINLYVATGGNDAWSGRLEKANAGRTDGPLQTLAAARDRARALRGQGPAQPVNIILRGGTYYLPETLALTPEDSGAPNAPAVWKAYPGEAAFISGGRPVTGLKESRLQGRRAWQVTLPEVAAGGWTFRQLFVHKQGEGFSTRRFRPHRGMLLTAGTTYSPQRKTQAHRAAQPDFLFFPGDLQEFANLPEVEIVALHSWSASRLKIKSLDTQGNVVTLTSVPTFRIGHWYKDERNPYYLENVREDLKQPGQFYLDQPTGMLTYLPLPGETLQNTTLVAPRLEKLVTLTGDYAKEDFVHHVRFEGLRFGHSEWPVPTEGYDTSQGQPALSAAIEFVGARECGLERCVITQTGAYGVSLGLGCQECFVRGCFLYDLGGGGVKVGDNKMNQQAQFPMLPIGNRVENNTITHTGVTHYSANGIWCGIVKGTKIRHNEVSHNPYTGIACGWNWSPAVTSAGDNLIERNHVHHVMDLVQDGGGIYTLGRQPGNVIRGNLIHDNHASPFACGDGQIGLYFDEGSTGFLVEDNIVYGVDWNNSQIAQNRNAASDHVIRNNFLGITPDNPQFPKEIAAQAGVEKEWRGIVFPVRLTPNPVYAMTMPALPPLPVSFNLTFEEVPVGMMPKRWNVAGVGPGVGFEVTDELAATGRRSLKATDKEGLGKPFYPYAYKHMNVSAGPVVLEFDFRQGEAGGEVCVEFRDYQDQAPGAFSSGPSFVILPDGKLTVGGKMLAELPAGQWSHVKVAFSLSEGAAKEYELTVAPGVGPAKTFTLPFAKADFKVMTDLYIISNGTTAATFHLDNLKLQVEE
jgi:hypothetical protein